MKRSILSALSFCVICLFASLPFGGQTTLDKHPRLKGSPYSEAIERFLAKKEDKIIGGRPAGPGQFPWQISLGVSWLTDPYNAHFCGGSVYSSKWIITAAHCMEDLNPWDLVVTAGTNQLIAGSSRINVRRIITHKSYDKLTYDNDIALIELWTPLILGKEIKAVGLIKPDTESDLLKKGSLLVVTGWGRTSEQGDKVRVLQYLDNLPFVDRSICNEPLSYDGKISENMICAGSRSGGMDSCKGDSGGPLSFESEKGSMLAGVVSWGEGCGRPNKVGVYTRIAKYVDWIESCTTSADKCNK